MLNRLRALSPRNALEAELANARYLRSISKIEDAVKALELAKSLPLAQDSTQEAAHTIRWLLAELLAGMGEYARAEATLDETIKWQGRSLPPEHPRLLISAAERLRLLARIRPSPMLADEIEELLPITESTFGAGSLRHIFLKSALGTTLFNSGNTQDGLKHLLAALSAHTEALSPNSLSVIQAKIHATSFLLAEGSEESTRTALQLSESAAKDAFATFGNNAPISFLSRVQHCQSLAKLELWEATEECIHGTLVFTDNARRNHSTRRSLEIVEITLQQSEFCLSNTSTEHCRK
jgi:hypothetical protein